MILKVLAIIPAYNEAGAIVQVISGIRQNVPEIDILVVNDGSLDETGIIADKAGAFVVNMPYNLGIGGAVQTGYIYALQNGYDAAVQVDGDGQHDPSFICRLLAPIEDGSADMVIGSRFKSSGEYKAPVMRKTGMLYFSSLVLLFSGLKIKDTTSGFRAVNRKIITYFSEHYPSDYPEVDVLVKLFRKRFRILELSVRMNQRINGKSSITPLRSAYYMIKVSLSLFIEAIRS